MWNLFFGDDDEEDSSSGEEMLKKKDPLPPSPIMEETSIRLGNEELKSTKITSNSSSNHAPSHQSTVVKHRLPSPVRQAGDGMEEVATDKALMKAEPRSSVRSVAKGSELRRQIRLPMTNISVDKLPPITDDKVRLPEASPTSPLVKMTPSQPHRSERGFNHFHKTKEPKFVPYEPYKAAITPLIVHKKIRGGNRNQTPRSRSETPDKPSNGEKIEEDVGSERKIPVYGRDEKKLCSIESPSAVHGEQASDVIDGPEPEVQKGNEAWQKLMNEKDVEVEKLKKQLAEAEKQLRIQTQVNSEVKKLLVASVGEDIEAKVDFLTQDKARLAADMRQYSYQISKDFEEKEKLSVQSDVWKSKFLACSVIVDELARWKGMLLQHHDDTEHYIRLLFHERNVLWTSLMETHNILERLRTAFDPLGVLSSPTSAGKSSPKTAEAASILGMADLNMMNACELRDRLLGETKLKTSSSDSSTKIRLLDTPAEEGLREVLVTSVEAPAGYSDLASVAVTGAAKPHLMKMGDKLSAPTSYKCCTHCQGTVQIV